ncbi:unnamed protein product [Cylicocyclus nassatus]|uniref:Uncharacterized protein n=1 Tax=Cylicocyclus nassatus TaxID=53992 RepID=A0AA36HFS7_CYLNA|nr:unnamed protein product [Cylicocyclus nassatus]
MMTYGSKNYQYGRSPRQEMLDDMREELLKAKKANAQLALDNRLLNTKLQRLSREIRIYTGAKLPKIEHTERHQQSGSNSTERHQQSGSRSTERHQQPSSNSSSQSNSRSSQKKRSRSKPRLRSSESKAEPIVQIITRTETSPGGKTAEENELSNQIRVLHEKNKKKLKVAKAYAEQNRKLKERLKQMREEFHELQKIPKIESGSGTPSIQLNGLESHLVDLVSKLESTRFQENGGVDTGDDEETPDDNPSEPGQDDERDTNSDDQRQNGTANKSANVEDQVPPDVLLYVISELATAHYERRRVLEMLDAG